MDRKHFDLEWQTPLNPKGHDSMGYGITQHVVWYVVKDCAACVGIKKLAPRPEEDLGEIVPRWAGELEQINSCGDTHPPRRPSDASDANRN